MVRFEVEYFSELIRFSFGFIVNFHLFLIRCLLLVVFCLVLFRLGLLIVQIVRVAETSLAEKCGIVDGILRVAHNPFGVDLVTTPAECESAACFVLYDGILGFHITICGRVHQPSTRIQIRPDKRH